MYFLLVVAFLSTLALASAQTSSGVAAPCDTTATDFSLPVWEEFAVPLQISSFAEADRFKVCSGKYHLQSKYPVQCTGDPATPDWQNTLKLAEYSRAYVYFDNSDESFQLRYKADLSQWNLVRVDYDDNVECIVDWTTAHTSVNELFGKSTVTAFGEHDLVDLTAVDADFASTSVDDCASPLKDHTVTYAVRKLIAVESCTEGYEGTNCLTPVGSGEGDASVGDTTDPVISFTNPPTSVQRGSTFDTSFATCTDDLGAVDLNSDADTKLSIVDNLVTANAESSYTITFTCSDGTNTATKTVEIPVACPALKSGTDCSIDVDAIAPQIDTNGVPIEVTRGHSFVAGATCTDASNTQTLSSNADTKLSIVDNLVTANAGSSYPVTFTCTDASGNTASATVQVTVSCEFGYEGSDCSEKTACGSAQVPSCVNGIISGKIADNDCTCTCENHYVKNDAGACVCENDMDEDGICDEQDACAFVQCQCYGAEECPDNHLKCFDTTLSGSVPTSEDYQCKDETGTKICDDNGFTGKTCSVCAAGFGWDGDVGSYAECVECKKDSLQYNHQDTHDARCTTYSCPAGFGGVFDKTTFDPESNYDIVECEACPHGKTSDEGDGVCAEVVCPAGQEWLPAAPSDPAPGVTYFDNTKQYVADAVDKSAWCYNAHDPAFKNAVGDVVVEAHSSDNYVDNTDPMTCEDRVGDDTETLTIHKMFKKDNVEVDMSNILQVPGSYTATYSCTDAAGKAAASVSRVITVQDTTKPTLGHIDNVAIFYGDPYASAVTCTDNIDTNPVLTFTGSVGQTPGTYALQYTCTDASENTATATVQVTVSCEPGYEGNECSVIECGIEQVPSCVNGAITGTIVGENCECTCNNDNWGGSACDIAKCVDDNASNKGKFEDCTCKTNYAKNDAGACVCEGPTCQDSTGDSDEDTTPPQLHNAGDVDILYGVPYASAVTCTDNIDAHPDLASTGSVGQTPGTYALQYTCTDASGNTATATVQVTVSCETGYEGNECSVIECGIEQVPSCVNGAITGTIVGENCECTCNNDNWGGSACDIAKCVDDNASNKGKFEDCTCKTNYAKDNAGACVCENDMDGDGICDEDDACASVQCQCYGAEECPDNHLKCFDTTLSGSVPTSEDYQCKDEAGTKTCDDNGFTGKTCSVCAAGFGWDGDVGSYAECVECKKDSLQYNHQDTHDARCTTYSCSAGFGGVFDKTTFDPESNYDNVACEACPHGKTSDEGDGVCAEVECPAGQEWLPAAPSDPAPGVTYFDNTKQYVADAVDKSAWCYNAHDPAFKNAVGDVFVEAHSSDNYVDNTGPMTCEDVVDGATQTLTMTTVYSRPSVTRTYGFDSTNPIAYSAVIDGEKFCEGDTLDITGTVFGDHPLRIVKGTDKGSTVLHSNSGQFTPSEASTYTFFCDNHRSTMTGTFEVLPRTDAQCQTTADEMRKSLGAYTATYSCTDAAGKAATSVSRAITVRDTTNPTFVESQSLATERYTIPKSGDVSDFVYYAGSCTDSYDNDPRYSRDVHNSGGATLTNFAVGSAVAGSYTITHTCTDAQGNTASHVQSVTISCQTDTDNDGVCNHNDRCAVLNIDCAHFTCYDTGTGSTDYQCKIHSSDAACSDTGFTGKECSVCAKGFGWNGESDNDAECVPCVHPKTSHQTGAHDICTAQTCEAGRGVVSANNPFNVQADHSDTDHPINCETCPHGKTSGEGSGNCAAVVCPAGYQRKPSAQWVNDVDYDASKETHVIDTWCDDVDECASNSGAGRCVNGASCFDSTDQNKNVNVNDYSCESANGFSGKDNDVCAANKELYLPSGAAQVLCVDKCNPGFKHVGTSVNNHRCVSDTTNDGETKLSSVEAIRKAYVINDADTPAQQKAQRKELQKALRDYQISALESVTFDDVNTRSRNGEKPHKWLREFAVPLEAQSSSREETKQKLASLPANSVYEQVVGFSDGADIPVAVRSTRKKGDPQVVQKVVLSDKTKSATLGVEMEDGTIKKTVKFTGHSGPQGIEDDKFDVFCHTGDHYASAKTYASGENVACSRARGEPEDRTYDSGSLTETTEGCMQEGAENYFATAVFHDQALCCVLSGCSKKELSDAYTQFTSGGECDSVIGTHTDRRNPVTESDPDPDGLCQTERCQEYLSSIEGYYYGDGTCPR